MDPGARLEWLLSGGELPEEEIAAVCQSLVAGRLDAAELAGLVVALRAKRETGREMAAFARSLTDAAQPFPRPDYPFADSCGTGGDRRGTLNISTGVAFLAAACGLPVAKHGNRSVSSRSGSADIFEQLGIPLSLSPERARACLDEAGLCFLFAPQYHPGLRHAMPVRQALGIRTVFNLLGPLLNPARPPIQLVGVYDPDCTESVAQALGELGRSRALVLHGSGIDEMALHGPTRLSLLRDGVIENRILEPASLGVPAYPLEALEGGDAVANTRALADLLDGRAKPAYAWSVALNTGALLWIAGRCETLREGIEQAHSTLEAGAARGVLSRLQEVATRA